MLTIEGKAEIFIFYLVKGLNKSFEAASSFMAGH